MITGRKVFGYGLAVLGVLTLCATLGLFWLGHVPISPWPVIIGCLFGFIGFYLIDPLGAKDAGGFVETFTIRVLKTLRTGRTSVTVETENQDGDGSGSPPAPPAARGPG